jgi:hypothetical protein
LVCCVGSFRGKADLIGRTDLIGRKINVDHKKDYKPPEDKEVNNEEGGYARCVNIKT